MKHKYQPMISKHFSMNECTVSEYARIHRMSNIPNEKEIENIYYTASRIEQVREFLNKPMIVLSWFRSEELNKAVKGSKTSAHRHGLAVDFTNGYSIKDQFDLIRNNKDIMFDQLIYYPDKNFIHVGYKLNPDEERRQVMISSGGKFEYVK